MSFFTFAYLAKLGVWGLVAACLQGGLLWVSWLAWARATMNAGAIVRHRLACMHFAALALLPLLTLAVLHWTVSGMGVAPARGSPVAELPSLMAGYRAGVQLVVPLATLWLAGVVVMVLWLALDARRLARLRRLPAPSAMRAMVCRLAQGWIGTIPEVQIANITTPQIIGIWRPVLLAPRDLALHLSSAECESALLHELAHVRRRDFGWNLLQRIALILVWFHPAAWMLYRRLSQERELCCDALAVRHGASASSLARALVRLAESRPSSSLGMAISTHGDLTERIHRLLGETRTDAAPMRVRMTAMAASTFCLMALGLGLLGRADPLMADVYHASVFGPTISIDAHDAAGPFALQIKCGRVIAATLAHRPMPRNRIRQQGDRVTLLDSTEQPILALTVTPQGRIEWTARPSGHAP